MPVLGFNHLNIRTPDFKRTLEFMREVLGMKVSPVPGQDTMEKAAWIYEDSGTPIMHLTRADVQYSPTEVLPSEPPRGTGAIQHVAFTCKDYEGMRARLCELDLNFRERYDEKSGVRQVFVTDPTDIQFELYFYGD